MQGGKVYGKATGLYNKHHKYSVQWNPWHPSHSAYNFQQAKSFSQQTKTWIHHHLSHRLDNFIMESFNCADGLQKILSEIDLAHGDDSWIEDLLLIPGILYCRDIVKSILFLVAHLEFQAHFNWDPVRLTNLESCLTFRVMNMGDWWWHTQDQLPATAKIVPSFVHPTIRTWPIIQVISMPDHSISRVAILGKISALELNGVPEFSLCWLHVPQTGQEICTRHGNR